MFISIFSTCILFSWVVCETIGILKHKIFYRHNKPRLELIMIGFHYLSVKFQFIKIFLTQNIWFRQRVLKTWLNLLTFLIVGIEYLLHHFHFFVNFLFQRTSKFFKVSVYYFDRRCIFSSNFSPHLYWSNLS